MRNFSRKIFLRKIYQPQLYTDAHHTKFSLAKNWFFRRHFFTVKILIRNKLLLLWKFKKQGFANQKTEKILTAGNVMLLKDLKIWRPKKQLEQISSATEFLIGIDIWSWGNSQAVFNWLRNNQDCIFSTKKDTNQS